MYSASSCAAGSTSVNLPQNRHPWAHGVRGKDRLGSLATTSLAPSGLWIRPVKFNGRPEKEDRPPTALTGSRTQPGGCRMGRALSQRDPRMQEWRTVGSSAFEREAQEVAHVAPRTPHTWAHGARHMGLARKKHLSREGSVARTEVAAPSSCLSPQHLARERLWYKRVYIARSQ